MNTQNNPYMHHMKEVNEDLKTVNVRDDIALDLTNKQYKNLLLKAYKAGFSSANVFLESFIGDLTGWGCTNGSDERGLAHDWYERAFGMAEYYPNFRYHLFNYNYKIEEIQEMLEDEDEFERVYQEYMDESSGKTYESKEDCLKLLRELTDLD